MIPAQAADQPNPIQEWPEPAVPEMPKTWRVYRVRAGFGRDDVGEVRGQVQGEVGSSQPSAWEVQYQRRWSPKFGGWQPIATCRVGKGGYGAALRWSKACLPTTPDGHADGSGLDLHCETSVEGLWLEPGSNSSADQAGPLGSPAKRSPLVWRARVEAELGQEGQAHYLNFTLPCNFVVGAVVDPAELSASSQTTGLWDDASNYAVGSLPVNFYGRLSWPLPRLSGWACEAELEDSWAGLFRAHAQHIFSRHNKKVRKSIWPWKRRSAASRGKSQSDWSVEHVRRHGPVTVPHPLQRSTPWTGIDASPRAAIVPTTRLRYGSREGGEAALNLETAQSALGVPGWGTGLEVSRRGWATQLHLSGGSADGTQWGRPRYTVGARAHWGNAVSDVTFSHELQWALEDGQGIWASLQHGNHSRKPRVAVGAELVR